MDEEFLDGFEIGLEAWHNPQRSESNTQFVEHFGGALLDGFNEALAFASWLFARSIEAVS